MKKGKVSVDVKRKVLTVSEAAAIVGDTDRAIWQKIYRNMLPHRRWGRRVVILSDELDTFLKNLPGPRLEDVTANAEAATH